MIHECPNCLMLEKELAQALYLLAQAREQSTKATDLMMKGDRLREKMMLGAILGGAFETDAKKAQMAYIMTGKKL